MAFTSSCQENNRSRCLSYFFMGTIAYDHYTARFSARQEQNFPSALRKFRESVPVRDRTSYPAACKAGLVSGCTMRKWLPCDLLKSMDLSKPPFWDLLGPFLTSWSQPLDTEVVELISDVQALSFPCPVFAHLHWVYCGSISSFVTVSFPSLWPWHCVTCCCHREILPRRRLALAR